MSERECNNSSCDKSSCEGCPSRQQPQSFQAEANEYSCIRRVIGVVSGKGGVGKSMVTASLANLLASKGYKTGILDADITGPSIPKMYGVHGPAEVTEEEGITPCYTENGIALMSINLLLPDEAAPVIWRGPIIANVVKQFWTDVIWGDLDYLLVDMPPGTGDVPLTVFQSLPVNEIVMVTSPQDLVQLIVKKALGMAEQMHIPVKGIIENYSYFKCPDCGKEIQLFGKSHIDEDAARLRLKVLGKMPVDPSLAEASDRGEFHTVKNPYLDIDFE